MAGTKDFKIKSLSQFRSVIRNKGFDLVDGEQYSVKDVLDAADKFDKEGRWNEISDNISTPDVSPLMPHTMQQIIKESQEPLLVGTSLLQRMPYQYGATITFPAMGQFVAADIGEAQEYPEVTPQIGGATMTASVSKSGVAFAITEEVLRYSQWDILGMMMREAGKALARHKEVKIFNYINAMGVTTHNNLAPASSQFGVTSGRDLSGAANGSVTMDDVFDAYAQVIQQGFIPDTILLHPLTWVMWLKDPVLRAFALASGGGSFYATYSGNPAGRAPWENSNQGGLGYGTGQDINTGGPALGQSGLQTGTASELDDYPQTIDSRPNIPSYFPFPFRILVSPFIPFDPGARLTDIYVLDSSNLGVLLVDEEMTSSEWDNPTNDTRKVKIRERYGIGILEEGRGIAVMENVVVKPNEIVLPAQAQQSVSGSISAIDRSTAISL